MQTKVWRIDLLELREGVRTPRIIAKPSRVDLLDVRGLTIKA